MLLEVKGEAVVGEQRQSLLSVAPAQQGGKRSNGNFTVIWDYLGRSPQEPQCRTQSPVQGRGQREEGQRV